MSPFLFSILMTVVLHDARSAMVDLGFSFNDAEVTETLYADDTLLIHSSAAFLETYMKCIEQCGREYGLKLNFEKVEALPVKTQQMSVRQSLKQPTKSRQ